MSRDNQGRVKLKDRAAANQKLREAHIRGLVAVEDLVALIENNEERNGLDVNMRISDLQYGFHHEALKEFLRIHEAEITVK